MKSQFVDLFIRIRASYWFIPSLMATAAILGAMGLVYLDGRLGSEWLLSYPWIYANKPAGAQALLSTVAGSMITVAGVTFSMTLLAVSHASAQIGPRLLTGFMRDRANQFTLGTFIATFLYCLIVLRTVHTGAVPGADETAAGFVPHLAIMVAVGLAMLSVAVLIYFIHHVPQSISVSNVVSRVGDELAHSIERMYPARIGLKPPDDAGARDLPDRFENDSKTIRLEDRGGYLRVLDGDQLLDIATEHDLIIRLAQRPGDFGVTGQLLMEVWPADRCDDDVADSLRGVFSWGAERTREQDALFPAEQLIEVLGKAMSPGVNGQYTAMLCIDQFERAFVELLQRDEPHSHRVDEKGDLRVVANPISHREFLTNVFRPLRQFVRDDWISTNHFVQSLQRLKQMPQLTDAAPLLDDALAELRRDVDNSKMADAEKKRVLEIANNGTSPD